MKQKTIFVFLAVIVCMIFAAVSVGAEEYAHASEPEQVEMTEPETTDPETEQDQPEPAEVDGPVIQLAEDQITSDVMDGICVKGTVSIGAGQAVGLFDSEGDVCYETVTAANSGAEETFEIPVAPEWLHYGVNIFTVRSLPVEEGISGGEAVTFIVVIPKKEQTITASDITFKEEQSVNVEASIDTGLPLEYVSSKPAVAAVNDAGVITGKRGGTTKLTIRQEGTEEYNPASFTITVTVIPTRYRIAFDPAGGGGEVIEQAVRPGQKVKLRSNTFKREGYKFIGWATASGKAVTTKTTDVTKFKNVNMKHFQLGKVKYKNRASVKNLAKVGKTVKLYAVWKGTGPAAAVDWADLVARDNRFGYNLFGGHLGHKYSKKHRAGKKKNKFGCYFCRTNNMSKKYCWRSGKTYVCMTFVNAAFAHGANCKTFRKKNKTCNVLYINGKANIKRVKKKCKALRLIGHPTVSKAKKGDVLIKNNYHVMFYSGKKKNKYYITEASTETGIRTAGYSAKTMNKILREYTVFRLK